MTESTSTANASDPILHGRGGVLRDCLFLLLIATLSVAPYVTRLGFYGDDWAILAALVNADDSSFRAMWDAQYEQSVNLQRRPTQILYQAVLFRASALNPLGYHGSGEEIPLSRFEWCAISSVAHGFSSVELSPATPS